MQYNKNKNVSLLLDPIPIKYIPEGKKSYVHLLIQVLRKVTVPMDGNSLHATAQMGVIRFKV